MKEPSDKPADASSGQITPIELAQLAVAIAHWKRRDKPAFIEAEEIIESARRHLSGDRQINSPDDYEKDRTRMGLISEPQPTSQLSEMDEIVQKLNDNESQPKITEPTKFPASRTSCLRLITGEKDPRRRARWLTKAGVAEEKGAQILSAFDFRILAAKLIPHLPRFGAFSPKRKSAVLPRDIFGKFTNAKIQRDARGRAKSIAHRDERGRILKRRA